MIVYIAAPLSQDNLAREIASLLASAGCEPFVPSRDAPQPGSLKTFHVITSAIATSRCVVGIFNKIGNDTSWELGYAYALRKMIVAISDHDTQLTGNNVMIKCCASRFFRSSELDLLVRHVGALLSESKMDANASKD